VYTNFKALLRFFRCLKLSREGIISNVITQDLIGYMLCIMYTYIEYNIYEVKYCTLILMTLKR